MGSVSTNIVALADTGMILSDIYIRTSGRPIEAVQEGMGQLEKSHSSLEVAGVGATGSGRRLAAVIAGADTVKNEITAHAVAAISCFPDVRTVIEIGGQDSKIILIRDGVVVDFAMNTVCAAGTGSFLDHQAARLGIRIEDLGELAQKSTTQVRIAGRCAVFAESDMIHKQQVGHGLPDIVKGLCDALVRNYLSNVGKGKDIQSPVVFQGGVAANQGIRLAFEQALDAPVHVPEHHKVMGALGAALLAREQMRRSGGDTRFVGFAGVNRHFVASSMECGHCPNMCEVVSIERDGEIIARWGGRCGKWEGTGSLSSSAHSVVV